MRVAAVLSRALLVFAGGLGLLGCDRGFVVLQGERSYESIDGVVKVELVRTSTGGVLVQLLGGHPSHFWVRVHTKPIIDFEVDCPSAGHHVDLAENASGTLVAQRCRGTGPWTVLRLRGEGRFIHDCAAPVGTGAKPAFDELDSLSHGADRILGCVYEARSQWIELARAIGEDEGTKAAGAFLTKTALLPIHESDPWQETFEAQTDQVRKAARRDLCPAVSRGDAPMPLYARAARNCELTDANVGDAAISQLRRLASAPSQGEARPDAGNLDHSPSRNLALGWASVIAIAKAPRAAGEAACAMLPSLAGPESDQGCDEHPSAFVLSVLAATKTSCPAAARWLKASAAPDFLRCEDRSCTAMELERDLHLWSAPGRAPLRDEARSEVQLPSYERARRAIESNGGS